MISFHSAQGRWHGLVRKLVLAILCVNSVAAQSHAAAIRLLALGDSLTAGYNLPPGQSFADQLQSALRAKGYDIEVIQGGVSGDTSSGGKARLDWVLEGGKPDHVLVELGANDFLRGIDTDVTRANLDAILTRLEARKIPAMLAGMLAPPNLGAEYETKFNAIYPDLAKRHRVPLYPFFLDGVVLHPELQLADGMHPTVQGVGVMVENILPSVMTWLGPAAKGSKKP